MAGKREEIDVLELAAEVERQFACRLHGVGVEERAVRFGVAGELADGLDDARLIVGEHEADKAGVRLQREVKVVRREQAVTIGLEVGDLDAAALERLGRVQDRVVLDGGGD